MLCDNSLLLLCFSNWWPMFVLIFYFLSPIPTLIARRFAESVEQSSVLIEVCIFMTACIVVSAYGLPMVLARASHTVIIKICIRAQCLQVELPNFNQFAMHADTV